QLQELQWHFFFASVMLSIGYTYISDGHVRIDVLRNRFSLKLRKRIEILGCVIAVIPLSILLIWAGGDQAWRAFVSGEHSAAALGLENRWIIKSVVPIGGVLLLLSGIYAGWKNFAALRQLSSDGN
ncbi:MAG: TRAP transporter small permease subunit, partial [Anaerolineae bacterium]|nr:TRAP transporter small permease subunit [Anaerolineae bacterium]